MLKVYLYEKADLMIIAFGMNDGTQKMPVNVFMENITQIASMQPNKDCEFIFMSTMLPNPETTFLGLQPKYLSELNALEQNGVCVLDMTSFHAAMLTRKAYIDLTGNNINHPNDFMARCYAINLLSLLGAL